MWDAVDYCLFSSYRISYAAEIPEERRQERRRMNVEWKRDEYSNQLNRMDINYIIPFIIL